MSPPNTHVAAGARTPPVKRRVLGRANDLEALPSAWLVEFDGRSSEVLDRLLEDSRLLHALSKQGFEGQSWDRFKDALARYGLQVLRSWLRTAVIFTRCRERGLPTERPVRLTGEQVEELAALTVAEAIVTFRDKVLRTDSWDPKRGASLRTFFIGQCLLRYPRIYKKWLRDEQSWSLRDEFESLPIEDPSPSPEALAETRLLLARTIAAEPRVLKVAQILFLVAVGYDQAEVGRRLGMSLSSIESLLYRHRRKVGA